MKEIFADKMLGWLRHGPVYFCISGMHALCAWGAEYTVQPDGSKLITKLYVAENDIVSANLKNALQEAPVDYSDYGTGKPNTPILPCRQFTTAAALIQDVSVCSALSGRGTA